MDRNLIRERAEWELVCNGDQHVWTARSAMIGPLPGDKCDCGQAVWTDPEVPEDQRQRERKAPRLFEME